MNNGILYTGLFILGLLLSAISHVPMKKSAQKKYKSKLAEYLNFQVLFAYFLCGMTTVCTVIAYKEVPLSVGGVLSTLEYIFVAIVGYLVFREKINRKKLIRLCLIVFGALLTQF